MKSQNLAIRNPGGASRFSNFSFTSPAKLELRFRLNFTPRSGNVTQRDDSDLKRKPSQFRISTLAWNFTNLFSKYFERYLLENMLEKW